MHLIIERQHEEIKRQFAHWEKISMYEQQLTLIKKRQQPTKKNEQKT